MENNIEYHLSINMAMTLDGKVTRPDGKWYGLSSKNDRIQMDTIRNKADALIIGKNSILNDNPNTHIKYIDSPNSPRTVLLVRNGIIPRDRNVFRTNIEKPIVFCLQENYKELKGELGGVSEIHCLEGKDMSPHQVIQKLVELGYPKILLEGGPKLNYAFLRENLVHRIHLTLVPFLVGKRNLSSIVDGELPLPDFDQNPWKLVDSKVMKNEIFFIYERNFM